MKYHHRLVEDRLVRLASRFPIVVVSGARQVGKSTLLRHLFESRARVFVFDPVTDVGNARRDPELFLRLNPPPLVLDEVQHAPELLPVLKRLVDEKPEAKGQYFLTGSQQLEMLVEVQESFAGRALLLDLWPMSGGELMDDLQGGLLEVLFEDVPARNAEDLLNRLRSQGTAGQGSGTLLERIFRGGFPGLMDFSIGDLPAWFDSYLRTYVERDVRLLRALDEPHDFSRFLRLMAALTAQEVNASHLGREIGIVSRTAKAWLDTLRASFQVVLVDAFSGNTVKRISGRPKAYLSDTGFACHLLAISSPDMLGSHPVLGQLFETYVVTEMVKGVQALDLRPRLWHWRTSAGAEVDLLLERDGTFIPIEIKLASRPSRRDLGGIRSFSKTYPRLPLGPRIVIHGGEELYLVDEATVAVPVGFV